MKNEQLPEQNRGEAPTDEPGYRSGVAARLAGLSAATLRVWERRYQLTATLRSATGQRLYTASQVRRLGLLKQLVDRGHPIGTLAALAPERLLALCGSGAAAVDAIDVIDVSVVGAGLVRRLAAAIDEGLPLRLTGQALGLGQAAAAAVAGTSKPADSGAVLLVELAEPDHAAIEQLLAERTASGVQAAVVLYRFCSSATVRALRAQGFLVARFPAELGELPLLCRAALQRLRRPVQPLAGAFDSTLAGRFDEAALAAIAAQARVHPSDGARGECARALADVLLNMRSFERYSARCADDISDPASDHAGMLDAAMHRYLEEVAAQARTLLEQAMGRLLRER